MQDDSVPHPDEQERLIAAAVADFVDRQSAGEPVDIESFCLEYSRLLPELMLDLRAEIDTIVQIDNAFRNDEAEIVVQIDNALSKDGIAEPVVGQRRLNFVEQNL